MLALRLFAATVLVAFPLTSHAQGTSSLLITPRELAAGIGDPDLVLLHVGTRENYDAGHIQGARFIQLQDVAAPRTEGALSLELPSEEDLRRRLEALGVGDGSRIVVTFGEDWVSPSTRVVWTLQAAGLGAQTRLLDGGTGAWRSAGLPLTKEAPPAPRTGRLTRTPNRTIVVERKWVQSRATLPGIRLLDARAPIFYEGPGMGGANPHEAGHIAGAKNLPFNSLHDDSLRLRPTEELRRIFANVGVQPGDTVVAYCHIGQQATVVLFAARVLGHPIRLYDGSMNEWEQLKLPTVNPTKPSGTGSQPEHP